VGFAVASTTSTSATPSHQASNGFTGLSLVRLTLVYASSNRSDMPSSTLVIFAWFQSPTYANLKPEPLPALARYCCKLYLVVISLDPPIVLLFGLAKGFGYYALLNFKAK
jgi:hypothetical protein